MPRRQLSHRNVRLEPPFPNPVPLLLSCTARPGAEFSSPSGSVALVLAAVSLSLSCSGALEDSPLSSGAGPLLPATSQPPLCFRLRWGVGEGVERPSIGGWGWGGEGSGGGGHTGVHQGEAQKRIWDSGPACRVVTRCDLPRALGVLGTGQWVWGENDTDGREVRGFRGPSLAGDNSRGSTPGCVGDCTCRTVCVTVKVDCRYVGNFVCGVCAHVTLCVAMCVPVCAHARTRVPRLGRSSQPLLPEGRREAASTGTVPALEEEMPRGSGPETAEAPSHPSDPGRTRRSTPRPPGPCRGDPAPQRRPRPRPPGQRPPPGAAHLAGREADPAGRADKGPPAACGRRGPAPRRVPLN